VAQVDAGVSCARRGLGGKAKDGEAGRKKSPFSARTEGKGGGEKKEKRKKGRIGRGVCVMICVRQNGGWKGKKKREKDTGIAAVEGDSSSSLSVFATILSSTNGGGKGNRIEAGRGRKEKGKEKDELARGVRLTPSIFLGGVGGGEVIACAEEKKKKKSKQAHCTILRSLATYEFSWPLG